MENLKLGIQLYTMRQYTQNPDDYASTMEKMAAIGYKYAQNSGIGGSVTPEIVAKVSADTGIRIILTHTDPKRILNDTDAVIEDHLKYGCRAIGIGGAPYGHGYDEYMRFFEDYAPAIEKIKKAGMVFLYHNHRVEFEKYNGKYGLELIMENTDSEGCKLTFDAYWAAAAGVDPADFIRKYGDRMFCTHFKDMAVLKDQVRMTELLTGNLNYDGIIAACRAKDLIWNFVEQDNVYIDAFESVKISHDNMKTRYGMD